MSATDNVLVHPNRGRPALGLLRRQCEAARRALLGPVRSGLDGIVRDTPPLLIAATRLLEQAAATPWDAAEAGAAAAEVEALERLARSVVDLLHAYEALFLDGTDGGGRPG